MTDDSNFSTRRRLASKINESTDVLWSNESLGEVADAVLAEFVVIPRSELPQVESVQRVFGTGSVLATSDGGAFDDKKPLARLRTVALQNLAVAEFIENGASK